MIGTKDRSHSEMLNNRITTTKKAFASQLPVGAHLVTVASISEVFTAAKNGEWNDKHPQAEVKFEKHDENGNVLGSIKMWLNGQGYKKYDELSPKEIASNKYIRASSEDGDEDYAIDKKTNERIICPDKTAKCMEIISGFAGDVTGSVGEETTLSDLVGQEVGIVVRAKGTSTEVHYTCDASRIAVEETV
jgi:hypothetical protein